MIVESIKNLVLFKIFLSIRQLKIYILIITNEFYFVYLLKEICHLVQI